MYTLFRFIIWLIKWALILAILIMAGGAVYEYVMRRMEDPLIKNPPGQLVNVGTANLHLYCEGEKGNGPTIILTAGLQSPSAYTDFSLIQPELAKTAYTCSYDRAGYAWSSKSQMQPTTNDIVIELDHLLKTAKLPGPYVLVGHSIGAFEVLEMAKQHPQQVKGLVLIDGVNPNLYQNYHPNWAQLFWNFAREQFGLDRMRALIDPPKDPRKAFIPEKLYLVDQIWQHRNANIPRLQEQLVLGDGSRYLQASPTIGDIPLLVLSAENNVTSGADWQKQQKDLVGWSTKSVQIVVPNSGHFIHLEQPTVVVDAIVKFMQSLPAPAAPAPVPEPAAEPVAPAVTPEAVPPEAAPTEPAPAAEPAAPATAPPPAQ